MNELYELIEKKIKESGYPRQISGADVYDDICDQIDGKENGTYLLLSKFEDDVIFEYHITINDEDFLYYDLFFSIVMPYIFTPIAFIPPSLQVPAISYPIDS